MEEQKTNENIRPTKKQHELLEFIDNFIQEHGYSPSYREIMHALNYTSVATVALHVSNLIKRGHLRKREHSARSLEVVKVAPKSPVSLKTNQVAEGEEKWLVKKVGYIIEEMESRPSVQSIDIEQAQILLAAMRILGLEAAAQSFLQRVQALKKRVVSSDSEFHSGKNR